MFKDICSLSLQYRAWQSSVTIVALLLLLVCLAKPVKADTVPPIAETVEELEYGVVLFDYFQQEYFNALIEQEYAESINNELAIEASGQLLKGGMMLSYGMADDSQDIFNRLLEGNAPEEVRNRAWYYLAKLYYGKSDYSNAYYAIDRIQGNLPREIHVDYHYLATLVKNDGSHLEKAKDSLEELEKTTPHYPYLLFNLAIGYLKDGNLEGAVNLLEQVTQYSGIDEELSILADRARHGLAELAIQNERLPEAWQYLKAIRTTGLYSNRALLAYAWAAIKLKQYKDAFPALIKLNGRSIALPEVQEAKVLLAHLYEQEGSQRKALKSNLLAEKDFKAGVAMIEEARSIIDAQDVPREFITNIEALMDDTDWYGTKPSVDYKKLTPFLIDLMSSHAFHETLRELGDLYKIEENLTYWSNQASEHLLILESASNKAIDENTRAMLAKIDMLNSRVSDQSTELRLHTLTLEEEDQERFAVVIKSMSDEVKFLSTKLNELQQLERPYVQPESYKKLVADKHAQIKAKLAETKSYIATLEPVMRELVRVELNKHEERMRYYWAQSRLAKARLYDITLSNLENLQPNGTKEDQAVVNGEEK